MEKKRNEKYLLLIMKKYLLILLLIPFSLLADDWCVSVRYDQLDIAKHTEGNVEIVIYENGEKKN